MDPARTDRLGVGDYARLPEEDAKQELVEGMLVREPLPGWRHGRVAARIAFLIGEFLESHPVGTLSTCDTGHVLSESPATVRGPDVAFVSAERAARIGDEAGFFPGSPDLAIEVLSPSDRWGDVHSKVADYLAAGARLVWVVDPERRTAVEYRTLLDPREIGPQGELDGGDVLPGFRLALSRLFPS